MAYVIKDSCIACGACAAECPVSCITDGDIYFEDKRLKDYDLRELRLKTGYKGKIRCHPVYTPQKIKNLEFFDPKFFVYLFYFNGKILYWISKSEDSKWDTLQRSLILSKTPCLSPVASCSSVLSTWTLTTIFLLS